LSGFSLKISLPGHVAEQMRQSRHVDDQKNNPISLFQLRLIAIQQILTHIYIAPTLFLFYFRKDSAGNELTKIEKSPILQSFGLTIAKI
jgi:hypothetical protein